MGVNANMNVGIGPLMMTESDQEGDERPTPERLHEVMGEDSEVFVEDMATGELLIVETHTEIENRVLNVEEDDNAVMSKKIITVSIMAGGGTLLFIVSALLAYLGIRDTTPKTT